VNTRICQRRICHPTTFDVQQRRKRRRTSARSSKGRKSKVKSLLHEDVREGRVPLDADGPAMEDEKLRNHIYYSRPKFKVQRVPRKPVPIPYQ
jgi:hypothetical protein